MLNVYENALEADREGNWNLAHDLIQHLTTKEAAWIPAYLHRKEGDRWNAQYWYKKAGRSFFEGSLDDEWNELMQNVASVKKS